MSQILDSLRAVKANYKPYDDWEQAQADDVAKRKYLSEKLDLPKEKVKETREKAKAVFRASDIMDRRSEDNCANMELATGLTSMAITLPLGGFFSWIPFHYMHKKGKMLTHTENMYLQLIQIVAFLIPGIAISLIGNAKQKEASRIGRYQARSKELQDPKNFVIYTPEQLKEAKAKAKKMSDKKEKDNKGWVDSLREVGAMYKDKPGYVQWRATRGKRSEENVKKALKSEFTPEQLKQGENDKEIIVNIVKDVNMQAETYSENVENVFDTIDTLSDILGAGVGIATSKILKKINTEKLLNLIHIEKILHDVDPKSVAKIVEKALPWGLGLFIPLYITLFWGTKKKKEASRVGRFVKRKEIIDNPELIMAYSDEQLKSAKDIKAPPTKKSFFEQIAFNMKFLPQYLVDLKAYKKYKKTEYKDNMKLYDALMQTEVTPEQLKAAKHLQSKTFVAFDKMDEMSQRYSEDTEAACEIANQLFGAVMSIAWLGVLFAPLIFIEKAVMKKEVISIPGTHKFLHFLSRGLNEHSSIRKLVHDAYCIISADPKMKKDFGRILFDKNARLRLYGNQKLRPVLQKLNHIITVEHADDFKKAKKLSDVGDVLSKIVDQHFKTDKFSQWVKNLAKDCLKLWVTSKKEMHIFLDKEPQPKNRREAIKMIYRNYKTLCRTAIVACVPVLGFLFGVPYIWNLFFTNIQIKAGRIGIMKAMDSIDNPKLFVETPEEENK